MSNKVFKNYQINLGVPFQVKVPLEELLDGYYDASGRMDLARAAGAGAGAGRLGGLGGAAGIGGAAGLGEFGALRSGRPMFGADMQDTAPDGDGGFTADALFAGLGTAMLQDEEVSEADALDALDQVRAEAERILAEARAESAKIIENANAEAMMVKDMTRNEADAYYAKVRDQAASEAAELREQARREGEHKGREEGRAEYDGLIDEANGIKSEALRIKSEAEAEYGRLMDSAEGDALALILDIAKKVIGDEITQNRESLIYMIRDAFMHCTNKENVVLKVSSDDFEYVEESRDMLLSMVEGLDKLEIKRDLALAAGSCQIESPFGNLDAGAQTRFSKIEGAFYSLLSSQRRPASGYTA